MILQLLCTNLTKLGVKLKKPALNRVIVSNDARFDNLPAFFYVYKLTF